MSQHKYFVTWLEQCCQHFGLMLTTLLHYTLIELGWRHKDKLRFYNIGLHTHEVISRPTLMNAFPLCFQRFNMIHQGNLPETELLCGASLVMYPKVLFYSSVHVVHNVVSAITTTAMFTLWSSFSHKPLCKQAFFSSWVHGIREGNVSVDAVTFTWFDK